VRAGVEAVTGLSMPVFPKRRFQHGALEQCEFARQFDKTPLEYRRLFLERYVG